MSLRVRCRSDPTADDEYQNTVAPKSPSWTAAGSVFRAGRELSSWVFGKPIPSQPSHLTDCCAVASKTTADPSPPHHINALPQEMLEEIFRQYLHGLRVPGRHRPEHQLTGSFSRIVTWAQTNTTPFTLAHTCSLWRTIVMSNASFWSRVHAFRPQPCDFHLLDLWLSLSGSCPLDITITQTEPVDGVTERILLLAMSYSSRWESINLKLDADMECLLMRALVHLRLPQLEQFRLDLDNLYWSTESVAQISHLLSSGPRIRGATFNLRSCDAAIFAATNWGCMSAVCLHNIQLVDLLHALPKMDHLQTLSIMGFKDKVTSHTASIPRPPILLENLTSLSLESYGNLSALCDALTLPSLRSLCLGNGFGFGPKAGQGCTHLALLIKRSRCKVLSLDWTNHSYSHDTLVHMMSNASASFLPSLQRLRFGSSIGNEVVVAFAMHSLFSDLRSMELGNCNADPASLEALALARPQLHVHGYFNSVRHFSIDFEGSIWSLE